MVEQRFISKTVAIVAALFILLLLLARVANHHNVDMALAWLEALVGLFIVLVGGGSSAVSLMRKDPENRFLGFGSGIVGVLAGSTLLGAGGWGPPVALGLTGLGVGIGFAIRHLNILPSTNSPRGRHGSE